MLKVLDDCVPGVAIVSLAGNDEDCLAKTQDGYFFLHLGVRVMGSSVMKHVSPELVRWFSNQPLKWCRGSCCAETPLRVSRRSSKRRVRETHPRNKSMADTLCKAGVPLTGCVAPTLPYSDVSLLPIKSRHHGR